MRVGVRLGVDVGEARVGIARSDPEGILATPEVTLDRDHEGLSDVDAVVDLVRGYDAIEVVVGLPTALSGNEGLAASRARDYAGVLHRRLPGVSVRLVDERLTTVDAHRILHASGVRGRQHRSRIDQAAAVLILQTALESERRSGSPAGRRVGERKPRTKRSGAGPEG